MMNEVSFIVLAFIQFTNKEDRTLWYIACVFSSIVDTLPLYSVQIYFCYIAVKQLYEMGVRICVVIICNRMVQKPCLRHCFHRLRPVVT